MRVAAGQYTNVLIKRVHPAKWNCDDERNRQEKKARWLDGGLGQKNPAILTNREFRRWLAGEQSFHLACKNGLAEFHPDKKPAQPQRSCRQMLIGIGATTHVSPIV